MHQLYRDWRYKFQFKKIFFVQEANSFLHTGKEKLNRKIRTSSEIVPN